MENPGSYHARPSGGRKLPQWSPGTKHWLYHRATLIVLIPLSLWAIFSMIPTMASILSHSPHAAEDILFWLKKPLHSLLLGLWLRFLIHHATLCLQTMIDDYLHSPRAHKICLFLLKTTSWALFGASLVCLIWIRIS